MIPDVFQGEYYQGKKLWCVHFDFKSKLRMFNTEFAAKEFAKKVSKGLTVV